MQSLYRNGLEQLYDVMYQSFIDYKAEFDFYDSLLIKYSTTSIIEIGNGTGNLAKLFIENERDYTGLDLSKDMIRLSRNKNPSGKFIQGDIIDFKLSRKLDAALITGRTTSYLTDNKMLNSALQNIYNNLNNDGLLIFDFIDAVRFFNIIKNGFDITHKCDHQPIQYLRESQFKVCTDQNNFMFNWNAQYYKIENGEKELITKDDSDVRAFTKEEWKIFLNLNNFEVLECINRSSYAFDTYVIVAKKI